MCESSCLGHVFRCGLQIYVFVDLLVVVVFMDFSLVVSLSFGFFRFLFVWIEFIASCFILHLPVVLVSGQFTSCYCLFSHFLFAPCIDPPVSSYFLYLTLCPSCSRPLWKIERVYSMIFIYGKSSDFYSVTLRYQIFLYSSFYIREWIFCLYLMWALCRKLTVEVNSIKMLFVLSQEKQRMLKSIIFFLPFKDIIIPLFCHLGRKNINIILDPI